MPSSTYGRPNKVLIPTAEIILNTLPNLADQIKTLIDQTGIQTLCIKLDSAEQSKMDI